MQGFAAVETDGVVKIVPEADAKTQAGPVQRGTVTASGERIVTQVIALRYESAAQLVTVLRPLISPNNTIAAYTPDNAIIITDYADNLKRIDRIVASLDQPPAGEPMLVQVNPRRPHNRHRPSNCDAARCGDARRQRDRQRAGAKGGPVLLISSAAFSIRAMAAPAIDHRPRHRCRGFGRRG